MQSLKEFYKEGPGPSSSHTMGPQRAAKQFKEEFPNAKKFIVTLYGSLSLTGKGHLTDWIIEQTLTGYELEIIWEDKSLPRHPNGMKFVALDDKGEVMGEWTVYSVGGGTIEIAGQGGQGNVPSIYPHNTLDEIYNYIRENNITLVDYIKEVEGDDILEFISDILDAMMKNTNRGLVAEGLIPGKLKLERVGKRLLEQANNTTDLILKDRLSLQAYAYAMSEENASGGFVVTAPTCGAAGIIPALWYYYMHDKKTDRQTLLEGLAVAGLFGNLIKQNATISGAEGGCQAECGTATAMGAAGMAYMEKLDLTQIEYAAENAIEHLLGLTCDPVFGYVQIPCIERNALCALRARDSLMVAATVGAIKLDSVSFDTVVRTMKETGQDLKVEYRETALGGLATNYFKNNKLEK
ncbi:L-serine ammonia-lyase, iron-sulfur-dependent, subunit alpha [Mycoplasma sp. P36-A1]|uniref:L-serine ammonia-lyase, iron-sulfur-dependent, subunit alpha n=1 Tax=Mycoplasma sp. P36-A1 TaxID=3252900 RepID=UPI003C2FC75A